MTPERETEIEVHWRCIAPIEAAEIFELLRNNRKEINLLKEKEKVYVEANTTNYAAYFKLQHLLLNMKDSYLAVAGDSQEWDCDCAVCVTLREYRDFLEKA